MKEYNLGKLKIVVNDDKCASLRGTLLEDMEDSNMRDYNSCMDGIESFLLALASEGVDVETEQFQKALQSAKDACAANNIL
jgi:hypothetical protein